MRAASLGLAIAVFFLVSAARAPGQRPENATAKEALREAAAVLSAAKLDGLSAVRLWCQLAGLGHRLGGNNDAGSFMLKAKEAAATLSPMIRHEAYRDIAKAYGRIGNAKLVIKLAANVDPTERPVPANFPLALPNPRDSLLQEAAREAAQAGQSQTALQIADAISAAKLQTLVKAAIGQGVLFDEVRAGAAARALAAVDALPTAKEKALLLVGAATGGVALPPDYNHGPAYYSDSIAAAQLANGNKAGATQTALNALALLPSVEDDARARIAASVVRILAGSDDLPPARKALALIPKAGAGTGPAKKPKFAVAPKSELLAKGYIAAAEVRAGRDDAALALVKDFDQPGAQAYILQVTALAQARAKRKDASKANFQRAVELVTSSPKAKVGGTSLISIAQAQALAGDIGSAVRLAQEETLNTGLTLSNISYVQAESGDFAGAKKTAALLLDDRNVSSYARACKGIARLQAEAGEAAAVRAWAAMEDDALTKATILVGMAEGLARDGKK
jgi:hypothetical protein